MRCPPNCDLAILIVKFGMVIGAFGHQGNPPHKPERSIKIFKEICFFNDSERRIFGRQLPALSIFKTGDNRGPIEGFIHIYLPFPAKTNIGCGAPCMASCIL
jgi:hypothetical protein